MNRADQTIIVQKYGGSSLSTLDRVRRVARKVVGVRATGRPVVVVVSAMGNTTSELVERAKAISPTPSGRELDVLLSSGERMSMALLAMAIQEEGHEAISLTGPQCGIVTDADHANATIRDVRADRVHAEIGAGRIVIVAGYQGASPDGEVTTLGRGGSDTTAVALAAALGAGVCEIYSDVPGVYTADPRTVERARHLRRVDSRLMSEYAKRGARVLHAPCLDLARRHGVSLRALATFGGREHTRIEAGAAIEYTCGLEGEARTIVGIASRGRRIRVRAASPLQGEPAELLAAVEGTDADRKWDGAGLDVLLGTEDVPDPDAFAADVGRRLAGHAEVVEDVSSVSVVAGATVDRELVGQIDDVLAGAGTTVLSRYDRRLSVTRAVPAEERLAAVRALHEALVECPVPSTIGMS